MTERLNTAHTSCLNCDRKHLHDDQPLTFRICWGCGSHINPCAKITSAAFGEPITVHRLDGSVARYYAHTACLDLHMVAAERPQWRGRISRVERPAREP